MTKDLQLIQAYIQAKANWNLVKNERDSSLRKNQIYQRYQNTLHLLAMQYFYELGNSNSGNSKGDENA